MGVGGNPGFRFPETEGHRPPDLDRTLKFRRALKRLAAGDTAVHQQILEVQHLSEPHNVPRHPAFVERVQAMMAEA